MFLMIFINFILDFIFAKIILLLLKILKTQTKHKCLVLSVLIISLFFLFSCKKEENNKIDEEKKTSVKNDSIIRKTPTLLFYLDAKTSSGEEIKMNVYDIDTLDTYDVKGFALGIVDPDSCILSYTYGFSKFPLLDAENLPKDVFLFSFTRLFSKNISDCENAGEAEAFPDLFAKRHLSFVDDIKEKGVVLNYTDKNGNAWTTLIGDQTNSSFEIQKAESFENAGIEGVNMKVEGIFNAVLYSSDSSQTDISINSAKYKVLFINAFN